MAKKTTDMIPEENVRPAMFVARVVIDFREVEDKMSRAVIEDGTIRIECKSSLIGIKTTYPQKFIGRFSKGIIRFWLNEIQIAGVGMNIYNSYKSHYCLILTHD